MIASRRAPRWTALAVLAVIAQLPPAVQPSSLTSTKAGQNQQASQQQASQHQQPPMQQTLSSTTLPSLLTTIVQDGANHVRGKQHSLAEGSKQRSNNDEHDDMVPLATINNHSRNNQAALRPPQYVDVSALIGSRNSTTSGSYGGAGSSASSNSNGAANSNNALPNSMLSTKSRSGLPECATQQVCNAIFVRMNHTQRLCECSSNYNWKCSNNLDPQDGHTIELTRKFDKRIYTQIKTCEPLREVRACKSPTDWTLLALQSERSGKAHYVVVCKCPTWAQLEGPYTHNHPPYANIPGIRVYGMLCAHQTARSSSAQTYAADNPALSIYPQFPWSEAFNVLNTTNLVSTLDALH